MNPIVDIIKLSWVVATANSMSNCMAYEIINFLLWQYYRVRDVSVCQAQFVLQVVGCAQISIRQLFKLFKPGNSTNENFPSVRCDAPPLTSLITASALAESQTAHPLYLSSLPRPQYYYRVSRCLGFLRFVATFMINGGQTGFDLLSAR